MNDDTLSPKDYDYADLLAQAHSEREGNERSAQENEKNIKNAEYAANQVQIITAEIQGKFEKMRMQGVMYPHANRQSDNHRLVEATNKYNEELKKIRD